MFSMVSGLIEHSPDYNKDPVFQQLWHFLCEQQSVLQAMEPSLSFLKV